MSTSPSQSEPSDTDKSAADLDQQLRVLARVPHLLVACDYDGTIAPIVDDPDLAVPRRETVAALRTLAELPQTNVAVISGRSLRDLAALSRLPNEIHLVGSHGSEFDVGFRHELSANQRKTRDTIRDELSEISSRVDGSSVEEKPAAVAFHYRRVTDEALVERTLSEIESGPGSFDGVTIKRASKVIELLVVHTDKGDALQRVRHQVGASAVLFVGDDVTDEDAFATLRGPDLSIKVGSGDTIAQFRVDDTVDVSRILAGLAVARQEWLVGAGAVPIASHSLLSDQRTVAIVTPDARITWMCVPRIDSAAVFAELLDGPAAGYFSVTPANPAPNPVQEYEPNSLRLITRWSDLEVTDYLDCSAGRPDRLAGRSDLLRVITARHGPTTAVVEFAPRLDFGRCPTRLEARADGLEVLGGSDLLALRSPGIEWEIIEDGGHHTARATIDLDTEPVVMEFRCGTANLRPEASSEEERRIITDEFWGRWASRLPEPPVAAPLVRRSALTLKALCYRPSGAMSAAATTSLPEHIGGIRNWDYRYCWLRDTALATHALARLGSHTEAMDYLDWVLRILETSDGPERLHPLYNVMGHHLGPEAEIAELSGYAGSRPVRVGNAAAHQVQLDVFGPIVDLVHLLVSEDAPLSGQHWDVVQAMVQAVAARWAEPDHGIWEIRKAPRHHVYSKVMCWLAVDRGISIADHFTGRPRPEWETLRATIADDIETNGFKAELGGFGAAYDGSDVDAASLAVGLTGFLAPDDPRFAGTIKLVEERLLDGPTVYRYLNDDGLPGREGGFNLMTSWLIDSYALVGRTADAEALFEQLCALAGPTGLLAEEHDPETGRSLGNHPQAYSHLGVINNALTLSGNTWR